MSKKELTKKKIYAYLGTIIVTFILVFGISITGFLHQSNIQEDTIQVKEIKTTNGDVAYNRFYIYDIDFSFVIVKIVKNLGFGDNI